MNYSDIQIVLQEVPNEISVCFTITGCQLRCEGCHSPYLWKKNNGTLLTNEIFISTLKQYQGFASCVLFMGGEWNEDSLINYLKIAQKMNYKTCLYSGLDDVSNEIKKHLTWMKTGAWRNEFGGLDCLTTNQKFIEVKSKKVLNQLFIKN
jgi:anaerobic ribonucleoside-triphosphate reductase activating protein